MGNDEIEPNNKLIRLWHTSSSQIARERYAKALLNVIESSIDKRLSIDVLLRREYLMQAKVMENVLNLEAQSNAADHWILSIQTYSTSGLPIEESDEEESINNIQSLKEISIHNFN